MKTRKNTETDFFKNAKAFGSIAHKIVKMHSASISLKLQIIYSNLFSTKDQNDLR